MKLGHVSPTVGTNCCGFVTGFESMAAHGSKEQWNVRDTRV
jgi:hypothetical protein